jgi:uncharacterized repeat protein (TIGR03803 family)
MTTLNAWKMVSAILVLFAATAIAAPAQTFTTLVSFDGTNGTHPDSMTLMQGVDGNLYGTTSAGGTRESHMGGTVFKITPVGTLTTLFSFACGSRQCIHGGAPTDGLILGIDGLLYGTTSTGGSSIFIEGTCDFWGCGSIFRIAPSGDYLSTLYSFDSTDGDAPNNLVLAPDGDLYGTTITGGANFGGTFFKRSANGTVTTLYDFANANQPHGVIQATDGNFYGTTYEGGVNCKTQGGCGTAFRITPNGKLTTLYSFCSQPNCADGSYPDATLIQASDGNLYGTVGNGGNNGCFNLGCGTVFKITSTGVFSTLYAFCAQPDCADGGAPVGLVQATDGYFYGATAYGGDLTCNPPTGCGVLFQLTLGGTINALYNFESTAGSGTDAGGSMFQATNGILYGASYVGGNSACDPPYGCGTIYSLDMGLGPFVSFVRNPARVDQAFGILGRGFTGTTSVSLNGAPTTFTVKSDTLITARVPAGATTGYVTVATASGTLTSNVQFHVIP